MDGFSDWFPTAKQVVFDPVTFYEELPADTRITQALLFAVVASVISNVLNQVLLTVIGRSMFMGAEQSAVAAVGIGVVGGVIAGTVGVLIGAGLVHIFVYLFDGHDFSDTIRVVAYATAVSAFFGWIPIINILAVLYILYVEVQGLKVLHSFSTGTAIAAILLPIIIPVVLLLLIIIMAAAGFAVIG